jgi:hypothetical protein
MVVTCTNIVRKIFAAMYALSAGTVFVATAIVLAVTITLAATQQWVTQPAWSGVTVNTALIPAPALVTAATSKV